MIDYLIEMEIHKSAVFDKRIMRYNNVLFKVLNSKICICLKQLKS